MRPVVCGEGGRFAQQVGRAGDREAWREGVAQPTIGRPVPALAEFGRLAQARLQDLVARQSIVVGDAVHHDLADDRADAVRLGRPEAGVQAVRPDGAVARERRRADGGHGAVDLWRQALGRRRRGTRARAGRRSAPARPAGPCPAPRPAAGTWGMWTCVSTNPGMTTSGRRSMACSTARGARRPPRAPRRCDPRVDVDDAVRLPARGAIGQRRQQARTQAERRSIREGDWHGRERRTVAPRRQRGR